MPHGHSFCHAFNLSKKLMIYLLGTYSFFGHKILMAPPFIVPKFSQWTTSNFDIIAFAQSQLKQSDPDR